MRLNGWLLNPYKPIKRIYVENFHGELLYGFQRDDVYNVYPVEYAKSSGFSLFINGDLNYLPEFINVKVMYEDRSFDVIKLPTRTGHIERLKNKGKC